MDEYGCCNAVAVYHCHNCGEEIYEGDYYYEVIGKNAFDTYAWCADCIEDCRKEAILDDH